MNIKKILLYIFLFILIFFIETVVAFHFNLGLLVPDLFFILVLYIAWFNDYFYGEFFGFLLGLISDCFGYGNFGSNMFLFCVIGFFISRIAYSIDKNNKFYQIFIPLIMYYFYLLGFAVIQNISDMKLDLSWSDIIIFPILTAIFVPVIFSMFDYISHKWFKLYVAE